jgi:hypothetical protein
MHDPLLASPITAKAEPTRTKDRRDSEAPKLSKSRIEIAAPSLEKLRKDNEDPRVE